MDDDAKTREQLLEELQGSRARLAELERHQTAWQQAEAALRADLQRQELLLKDIHHRFRSNLQLVSSLLGLHAQRVAGPEARQVFLEGQIRLRALGAVHELLYQSGDLSRADLAQFIRQLGQHLVQLHGAASSRIRLEVLVGAVSLPRESLLSCCLVVTELLSNALRHAFPGNRSGQVRVELSAAPDQALTLVVADDGVGLPPDVVEGRRESLGLQLVRSFVAHLGAVLTVENRGGAAFTLSFPSRLAVAAGAPGVSAPAAAPGSSGASSTPKGAREEA